MQLWDAQVRTEGVDFTQTLYENASVHIKRNLELSFLYFDYLSVQSIAIGGESRGN